jgi:hypothetical protein
LKNKATLPALAATTLNLSDFPLGSPESRAAARLLLSQLTPKLSQDDKDALVLYQGACYLTTRMEGHNRLEGTPVYARGRELSAAMYGPVVPAHLDPHYKRSTGGSLKFEGLYGREPIAGDMLRRSDVERDRERYLCRIKRFVDAWQRQMPEAVCPLRIDNGDIYCCELQEGWRKGIPWGREDWWEDLAYELGVSRSEMQRIPAVVFLGVIDGQHRCRPATNLDPA